MGLVAYDLQAPAKSLYPAATPIRNRLPRVQGGTGHGHQLAPGQQPDRLGLRRHGLGAGGPARRLHELFHHRRAAAYATIGEEDTATFEAINAARGFEDIQASMATRLLTKTMLKEEMALLAGNATLQLGTPQAPVTGGGGTGATLPAATYSVVVVALTLEGYRNSTLWRGRGHHPHRHRRGRQELRAERRRVQPAPPTPPRR